MRRVRRRRMRREGEGGGSDRGWGRTCTCSGDANVRLIFYFDELQAHKKVSQCRAPQAMSSTVVRATINNMRITDSATLIEM